MFNNPKTPKNTNLKPAPLKSVAGSSPWNPMSTKIY